MTQDWPAHVKDRCVLPRCEPLIVEVPGSRRGEGMTGHNSENMNIAMRPYPDADGGATCCPWAAKNASGVQEFRYTIRAATYSSVQHTLRVL